MNVIFNTPDLEGRHIVGSRDAADKCPDAVFNIRSEPGLAILCRKNEVVVK